jgi:hypothetical protein
VPLPHGIDLICMPDGGDHLQARCRAFHPMNAALRPGRRGRQLPVADPLTALVERAGLRR